MMHYLPLTKPVLSPYVLILSVDGNQLPVGASKKTRLLNQIEMESESQMLLSVYLHNYPKRHSLSTSISTYYG